jgi:hypothetical protein
MELRKHMPIAEYYMAKEYPKNTICQLLRETYRMTDDEDVRLNLRIAVSMAKAMNRKLTEYHSNWQDGFWDDKQ